jgi:hypothetical protein
VLRTALGALCGTVLLAACSFGTVTFTPENGDPNAGPMTATLTVSRGGPGTGTVSVAALALVCGEACTATVTVGATVTLAASADPGAEFAGWSGGGCTGTDPTCVVTVTGDLAITARFDVAMFKVDVGLLGGGSGLVMATAGALVCPGMCTMSVPQNTAVELVATPGATSTFLGWGGACSGTGACGFTVTGDTAVTAAFAANNELDVTRAGNGGGTVTSSPVGILCGPDCSERFAPGTLVTLTAAPASDATFTGWSGAGCAGTGTCVVTMDAAALVTAGFALKQFVLTVGKAGNGSGTVTSSPAGIACGADCSEAYDAHTLVTLTAAAAADSTFTGWTGGSCSGTTTCVMTMDAAASVTAGFALKQFVLTVTKAGNGSGTVTSSPAGIACGADCTETYNAHTVVTLTAAAAADSTFTGWTGGGCSGTGTCVVTMDAAVSVTAGFALKQFLLTVGKAGNGSGTVTSSPAGIACGADCSEAYDAHTVVTLTGAAAADSTFSGWTGGGCTGTGTCVVTMDAAASVTAGFALKQFLLTVGKTGNGSGTVTSSPAGIACGADCTETYNAHTVVTLTAAAAADSTFTGWTGGGCSGTATCVVTMDAAVSVTAGFALKQFPLTVTKAGNGSGTVTSSPAGIACGADCSEAYDIGTLVTLTATPDAGSSFAGWSGGCVGAGTCQVTMTAAVSVTATFSVPSGLLAVANFITPSIEIFPTGAAGDTAPLRVISGTATTFVQLRDLAIVNNEIIVADQGANAIDVFPVTASGNVAPTRRIVGASTGLSSPAGILVVGGEIYVGEQGGVLAVFPLTASGDVAPSRTITGIGEPEDMAIVGGELYVADAVGSRILVFPANASGAAVPTRIIAGATTGLRTPLGLLISNGEIFVSSDQGGGITVFPQLANGDVAPLRVIIGTNTGLTGELVQMAITGGELYVTNFTARNVLVFPVNANGNVAPTRQITGPTTLLTGPTGVFAF